MRCLAAAAVVAGVFAAVCVTSIPASAEIVIAINKSKQRMAVMVDGVQKYVWKVSTGTGGAPKTGTYQPQRLEKTWFSHKYGMSPMPHSIFFHEGFAIHGTIYVSRLGTRASHGCVRLHPDNATTLFNMVKAQGMGSTTILVSNEDYVAPKPVVVPVRVDAVAMPIAEPKAAAPEVAAPKPEADKPEANKPDAGDSGDAKAADVPAARH